MLNHVLLLHDKGVTDAYGIGWVWVSENTVSAAAAAVTAIRIEPLCASITMESLGASPCAHHPASYRTGRE